MHRRAFALFGIAVSGILGSASSAGQTCSANPNPRGSDTRGAAEVAFSLLYTFPGAHRPAVETALERGIQIYNLSCPGHVYPNLYRGIIGEEVVRVRWRTGSRPSENAQCSGGHTFYPPAYSGQEVTTGIVSITVQEFTGCEGSLFETLGPGSIYLLGDNLTNLIGHELGHILGLGHDDCPTGLMNNDGQVLFDGIEKGIPTLGHCLSF